MKNWSLRLISVIAWVLLVWVAIVGAIMSWKLIFMMGIAGAIGVFFYWLWLIERSGK